MDRHHYLQKLTFLGLQSAFLLALLFLLVCSTITMLSAPEQQLVLDDEEEEEDWMSKMQIPLLDEDR